MLKALFQIQAQIANAQAVGRFIAMSVMQEKPSQNLINAAMFIHVFGGQVSEMLCS